MQTIEIDIGNTIGVINDYEKELPEKLNTIYINIDQITYLTKKNTDYPKGMYIIEIFIPGKKIILSDPRWTEHTRDNIFFELRKCLHKMARTFIVELGKKDEPNITWYGPSID